MKKILIATLLIGMISSCEQPEISKVKNANQLPYNTGAFIFENHQYLVYGNGGLIHSESCSNPIHKEKQK